MPNPFPPLPAYPNAIDTDRTLYLVHDTAEAPLSSAAHPWDEQLHVVARPLGRPEVWAENGFVTLNGELIYYDAVDLNDDDRVVTLKGCLRGLGGDSPRHAMAGQMVRGFVVAEHHNQLSLGVRKAERHIGRSFDPDEETLDWRIRNLANTDPLFDDFDCPDVVFSFTIVEDSPVTGKLARYFITVLGEYSEFRLSFGDGNFTTSVAPGEHRYAPNAKIDPVITIQNPRCTIVQSPIERTTQEAPEEDTRVAQVPLPIPIITGFGDILVQAPSIPSPDLVMPPVMLPCLDVSPFPSLPYISIGDIGPINVPSMIVITGISLPSVIEIQAPAISFDVPALTVSFPSFTIPVSFEDIPPVSFTETPIIPPVSFTEAPPMPPVSFLTPEIPPLSFTPCECEVSVPPVEVYVSVDVQPIEVNVTVEPISVTVHVDPIDVFVTVDPIPIYVPDDAYIPIYVPEGTYIPVTGIPTAISLIAPPAIPINVTVTCQCSCCPSGSSMGVMDSPWFANQAVGMLGGAPVAADGGMEMTYDFEGFPSVLTFAAPDIPPIEVRHDLPSVIDVRVPSAVEVRYVGPELPRAIEILPPPPDSLVMRLDAPKSIALDTTDAKVRLEMPEELPAIRVDASSLDGRRIEVFGFPESIPLVYDGPSVFKLEMPDDPVVFMEYRGTPISVVVQMELAKATATADGPCFMMVPCTPK